MGDYSSISRRMGVYSQRTQTSVKWSTGMRNKYILQHSFLTAGQEEKKICKHHASTSPECNLGGGVRRRVNVENRQSTGFPFPWRMECVLLDAAETGNWRLSLSGRTVCLRAGVWTDDTLPVLCMQNNAFIKNHAFKQSAERLDYKNHITPTLSGTKAVPGAVPFQKTHLCDILVP